jgi:hypothetical protein
MTSVRKRTLNNDDSITSFARDYRNMQNLVSRLSDDPLPPCYYCRPEQIWSCSQTSRECRRFRDYCSGQSVPVI